MITLIYFDPHRLLYTFEGVVDGEVKTWDEFAASKKVAWEHAHNTFSEFKKIKGGYKMVTFESSVYIGDNPREVLVMAHVTEHPKGYAVEDSPDLYEVDIIQVQDLYGNNLTSELLPGQFEFLESQAINELYPGTYL